MTPKEKDQKQGSLFFSLRDTLNPKHPSNFKHYFFIFFSPLSLQKD